MVAIFYPFSLFGEIVTSLPSLQNQPKTAPPHLFQRGVDYGKYVKFCDRFAGSTGNVCDGLQAAVMIEIHV